MAQGNADNLARWRAIAQAQHRRAHRWRADPTILPVEDGSRGGGWRRGRPGLADYPAGTYPACSLHGAMIAVGGEYWRCLIEGCNCGARKVPEDSPEALYMVIRAGTTERLHHPACRFAAKAHENAQRVTLAQWEASLGAPAPGRLYALCMRCQPRLSSAVQRRALPRA